MWYTKNTFKNIQCLEALVRKYTVVGGEMSHEEMEAYMDMLRKKYPARIFTEVTFKIDGDYVDIDYKFDSVPFNRIRRSYNYGPEVESFPQAQAVSAVPLTAYEADSIRQELAGVRYGRYVSPDKRHYEYAIGKTGIFFLAQISPAPEMAFGAGIGVLKSKGGAYLSFLGNFKSMSSDLEVLSDGTSSGSPVWLSGGKEKTKMVFTAGGLLRLSDNVSVLAGAGYGTRLLFWENSSGQWMKVTDCSYSGVAAEAGILLTLGRWNSFCLSAKAGTISFKYADFSIGIGYRF